MRLLLGSGGYRTPERIQFLQSEMRDFFGAIDSLLFIPYALHDHDRYVALMIERGIDAGYDLRGIHKEADPVAAVEKAQAIFVGGGNTFRLLHTLQTKGLLEPIRQRVLAGMPYMGVSAGTNVACPTIMTTNDMPIFQPKDFLALNLIPFQINAHYYSGHNYVKENDSFQEHFGETRDERLAEFHEMNHVPVLGLWEAGILRREENELTLKYTNARLFQANQPIQDFTPGTRLDHLLN